MGTLLRRWFLSLIVAVLIAMLGAIPLAQTSGFAPKNGYESEQFYRYPAHSGLVWVCAVILVLLTLAVMGPITRALLRLVDRLSRTETRPSPVTAATMIGSGTLLVLASLYLAWMSSASSPINQVRNQMQDMMKSVNANGMSFNMNIPAEALGGSGSGSGAMILTVMVFVLGTGLIALGVWASLPAARPIKTPIPASDAVSL